MKKICLIFAGAIVFAHCSAQETMRKDVIWSRHEVFGGVGLLSDMQVASFVFDVVGTVLTAGYVVNPGDYYNAFTPFAGYRYWFTPRFALGGVYAFDYNSVNIRKNAGSESENPFENHMRYYSTIAAECVLNYVYKPKWQLYGMIGAGVTIVSIPRSAISTAGTFNGHVSPIGMRFGGKVGGFIEFGYGYKGFINAGLSARF
jgi:hypothetical protein